MKKIGITTTLPIEILLAAGYQPVDLNNVFISDKAPERLVNIAERAGFPLNCCTWIKGIYGTIVEKNIDPVVCVTTGDCSNTVMLMEVLKNRRHNVIPFPYPPQPDRRLMQEALENLAHDLGTDMLKAERVRADLAPVRRLTAELDTLTWENGVVSGRENHYWLVAASDFNQNAASYRQGLTDLIGGCRRRDPYPQNWLRLAYIGVPPVFAEDFYRYLENNEARVVFNEVQRQFAMPEPASCLAEQYINYTYPYSINYRLQGIKTELTKRRVNGIIHYVQAFCHRGIGDIIFRNELDLPILTLEGNTDFYLTQHTKTRIEAFLDMVRLGNSNIKSQKSKILDM